MMRFYRPLIIGVLSLVAVACASGPEFLTIQNSIPSISSNAARIYFYRSGSLFGGALQPNIHLNRKVVGESIPGGVFFVDVNPGKYKVSLATEVERFLTFTLEKSETKYIKMSVGLGILVGRVYPELVDPKTGSEEIRALAYIGKKLD